MRHARELLEPAQLHRLAQVREHRHAVDEIEGVTSNGSGGVSRDATNVPARFAAHQSDVVAIDVASGQHFRGRGGKVPRDAATADAPIEHAREFVHALSRDVDKRAIDPMVVGGARDQESYAIAVADDAKPAVLVRQIRRGSAGSGANHESRPRSTRGVSATTRRISSTPSGYGSGRSSIAHSKPEWDEPARCQKTAPTSARGNGYAMRSKRRPLIVNHPSAARDADRHRPSGGRKPRAVDRHLVDVPGLGAQPRDDEIGIVGQGAHIGAIAKVE